MRCEVRQWMLKNAVPFLLIVQKGRSSLMSVLTYFYLVVCSYISSVLDTVGIRPVQTYCSIFQRFFLGGSSLARIVSKKLGRFDKNWISQLLLMVSIALCRNPSQSCGASLTIWDHSVTCHLTSECTRLHPSQEDRYLIYLPCRDGRLNWPRWLVTYRNSLPVHRQSPI